MDDRMSNQSLPTDEGRICHWLKELSQRRVGRSATTYALVMWLNLQVLDICAPILELPGWTLSFVALLGMLGFPLVVVLAWIFQITAAGVVVDVAERNAAASGCNARFPVDAILLLLGVLLSTVTLLEFFAG